MDLRFGILTLASGPISHISRDWRTAEELGFDSAWVADTLSLSGLVEYEAWTILAALAEKTSRLRIGTLVTQITFRHPAILATQAITLDHISGGRLEVGLGAGDYVADGAAVGVEPWPIDERLARLEEQLSILDPLLRGQPLEYSGRFYSTRALQLTAPVQHPRPRSSLRARCGEPCNWSHGSRRAGILGGQPLGKSGRPPLPLAEAAARTRDQARNLDDSCRRLGRDPKTIRRSVLPYRVKTHPLSSLDVFDEFVGLYAEAGIDEFIFYWPPVENLRRKEAVTRSQQAIFERIAAERVRR